MCGAKRSTPIMSLNAILHIVSIDIAERCMASKVAVILREYRFLNEHVSEQSEIIARFDYIWYIPDLLYHRVATLNSDDYFSGHIPARELWLRRLCWWRGPVSFFRDGLKFGGKLVEYYIFRNSLSTSEASFLNALRLRD